MNEHPPPQEARWPEGAIFTLGHSTLPIEAFLALLQAYGIERPKVRNQDSVAHLNTLTYLVINAQALQRARAKNAARTQAQSMLC